MKRQSPAMSLLDSFRQEVEAYLRESQMRPTDFSYLAARDGGFVTGLRKGRDPRLSTADKVQRWMRENPPAKWHGERR
jgi:predicted transcriptional regulator